MENPARAVTALASHPHKSDAVAAQAGSDVGFVLLKPPSTVLYANAEAMRILSYPHDPAAVASFDKLLEDKLGFVFEERVGEANFFTELLSGRRRYLCRGYRLESSRGRSDSIPVALQFERACRPVLDVRTAAERYRLSPRERQTLALAVQGLSNKEIAAHMGVSPNTVKSFLRLIMGKMGVSSRVGLIRKTIQILAG